ncbi:MAG: alpha/beta hydrolase, partial [Pseudomonadota bacterium]
MSDDKTMFLDVGPDNDGAAPLRRIAYRHVTAPQNDDVAPRPGLLWLSGFNSTMDGTKASAMADWAAQNGLAFTRFDYSGHGQSSGAFKDGTVSD